MTRSSVPGHRVLRGAVLVVALALTVGCIHTSAEPSVLGAGAAELDALPTEFTLASWNTHKLGTRRFVADLRRIAATSELLLLQEVSEAHPVWDALPDARAWSLVVAFELGRAGAAAGVATGSVATPIREQAVFSPTREPLTRTPKSALLSWIAVAQLDTPILVVNLHGINFRPARALAAQLAALDRALAVHAGPLVVAGDFNTWSRARHEVVEAFARRHDLVSAFTREDSRLDDVYVRGLVVVDAEVVRSRSSDHDALRVVLRLP